MAEPLMDPAVPEGQNRYTYFVSVYAANEEEAQEKLAKGETSGIHTLIATTDAELARKRQAELKADAKRRAAGA
jgi:hypothetical protein